ncbi:MAG: helix-turn-helix transcriptional regulator [Oscillospiraceae bacterium]|nr:helix-turn-helix transcriptional regulator [Oscillospiraceae bacterium]
MISYNNLWATMKMRGISQYALIKQYHISPAQLTRLKRNESVSTHTIEMFCKILHCAVEDIMEYIPDESIQGEQKSSSCDT